MTRNGLIATCCVGLLIAGAGRAHGLDPSRQITQYAHSSWRIQDGVFSGAPNAVAQTRDGYLWIGTQNGLVRFDGVRFVPWAPPNGKLLSSGIFSLLADADGSLWIGTGGNLARLKNGTLINFTDAPGRINAIVKTRNGTVWFTRSRVRDGGGPLCQVVDTRLHCYGKADGIAPPNAGPLVDDQEGNLWIGSANVLTRWRIGSSTRIEAPGLKGAEGLSGVQALAVTRDGSIWTGINRRGRGLGLQHLSQGAWKPFVTSTLDGSSIEVTSLFLDHKGTLWVGTTNEGIYRINGGKSDRFSSADGLSGNSVSGFYEDREGDLWVATSEGVDCFRDIPVTSFSTHEGLCSDLVYSVLATRDGTIWIGNHGALEFLRQGELFSIQAKNGLPGERVTSLVEDHAGHLWVGVDNELYVYEGGKFRQIKHPKNAPLGVIIAIAEDRDYTIWAEAIGNPTRLVRVQNGEVREEIPVPRVPAASSIAADPHGGIWLGLVNGGLARYQHGQLETFPASAKNAGIRQVLVGPDGSVLGASAAGLVEWWDGKLRTLTSQNGLPCDGLYGLVLDRDNSLWLYAECGLVKLASKDLQEWRSNANAIVKVETFDVFDGARPWSTTFQPSASRSPDGRLWFANENVVQMIDPGNLSRNTVSPPVHVEEVLADHKTYSSTSGVRLPPRTRDLEIDYAALSFAAPQKVRFRYKLESRDASWQEPGTRRQAFYSDLPPGKYRFRVIACNNDGVWNAEGATLDFSIAPAWFQTAWFRTLCVVVVFGLLWSLYWIRLRRIQRHFNVILQTQLSERTRIINTIPALAWSAGRDGAAEFFNQRWMDYTGLSAQQSCSRGWLSAIHPDDFMAVADHCQSSLANGKATEVEARVCRRDGAYRWFLFRTDPLRDKSGAVIKIYGTITDIEDNKRLEETLRANELSLRQIVDNIPGFVHTTSAMGEIEFLSRQTLEFFGKTKEDLKDWSRAGIVHPDDLPQTVEAWRRSIETGQDIEVEHRNRRADGVYRWIQARGRAVRNQEGEINAWYWLLTDIDDLKKAEEALQSNERNLSQIINTMPTLAWSARPDGSAEFLNQHYLDYVGLPFEDLQGWGWTVAVHPEDLNALSKAWQSIMASGRPGEAEARLRRFDGEFRWFLFRTNPMRDESGEIVKWYGTNTDIHDRKRAEAEVKESYLRLAEAQRLSKTGSFITDLVADEHNWSEETFRIFEFDPGTKVTVQMIRNMIHPEDVPSFDSMIGRAMTGKDVDFSFRFVTSRGAVKHIRGMARVIEHIAGRPLFIGALQDVTDGKVAEEALNRARSDLAHVSRVTTLNALTASIAHEINQPLSGIVTNASTCLWLLSNDPPDIAGARETAQLMIRDGNRASNVIERLRTLYGKKESRPESMELNEAAREVISLSLSDLQRNRVIVHHEFEDDLPPLNGDKIQIQQVILNLIRNASDAMSKIEGRPRELFIRTARDQDNGVRLSVKDVGIGFQPQSADKLFEAFYTTKEHGMGIGLNVSRSIIEAHRGHLWATANDGPGATFSFSIPCSVAGAGTGPDQNGGATIQSDEPRPSYS